MSTHTWVSNGMYAPDEDAATFAVEGCTVECEQCGVTYGSTEDGTECGTVAPAVRDPYAPHAFRGRTVVQVPTEDVRIGDRLCMWLSDASAYPTVTGWADETWGSNSDREARFRVFTVRSEPWWADANDRTAALTGGTPYGHVFILVRDGADNA